VPLRDFDDVDIYYFDLVTFDPIFGSDALILGLFQHTCNVVGKKATGQKGGDHVTAFCIFTTSCFTLLPHYSSTTLP
jgi:hypothetical protein